MASDGEIQIANTDQAAAWNGNEGRHWTVHAARYERSNRRHLQHLVNGDRINAGDNVLDIGCGTGQSTRAAARLATQGSALGADLSAPMLAHARAQSRADGIENIDFVQADAQVHSFAEQVHDVAISCFGAMFFSDPLAAFTNIGRALRPGGTLALLAWRELARNEWLTSMRNALALGRQLPEPPPAGPSPVSLADRDRVRGILTAAGYDDVTFEAIDEPVEFGSDADDAYGFMQTLGIVEGLTQDLDDADRKRALAELKTTVASHVTTDGVLFGSSVWLITARRS